MVSFRDSLRWHRLIVGDLFRARFHFHRRRDWFVLLGVYGLHSLAGALSRRDILCSAPVPGGERVTIRLGTTDFHVLKELFLDDTYNFALPLLAALDPPITTVVDLGANIGLSVRLWTRMFPLRDAVIVEPDRDNLALCVRNAQKAGVRLHPFRCFIGASRRTVTIDRRLGAWAYRMGSEAAGGEAIAVRTVPDVLADAGVTAEIDLLKCDVEGAEAEVFAGGPAWLSRVRVILVEVHGSYTAQRLLDDVRQAGGQWDAATSGTTVLLVRRD